MFGFACAQTCAPRDPATNTVKVAMPDITAAQAEDEAARLAAELEQEAQRRAEEHAEREAEAEAELQRLFAEEQRRAEEQRMHEEQRLREEREAREQEARRRKEREEAEIHEEARRAEAESLERTRKLQERKEAVAGFLKEHKFKDVAAPKKSLTSKTYPVHLAARLGNQQMVQMLLLEGADPLQKDSSGKTPLQVAQKRNRDGSHVGVLRTLGGA